MQGHATKASETIRAFKVPCQAAGSVIDRIRAYGKPEGSYCYKGSVLMLKEVDEDGDADLISESISLCSQTQTRQSHPGAAFDRTS